MSSDNGSLDFMLATLVGNGAAWSVATLPAIKVNSHPFQRLVKVAVGTFRTCRIALTTSVDKGKTDLAHRGGDR